MPRVHSNAIRAKHALDLIQDCGPSGLNSNRKKDRENMQDCAEIERLPYQLRKRRSHSRWWPMWREMKKEERKYAGQKMLPLYHLRKRRHLRVCTKVAEVQQCEERSLQSDTSTITTFVQTDDVCSNERHLSMRNLRLLFQKGCVMACACKCCGVASSALHK